MPTMEIRWPTEAGVDAERRPLEEVAPPLGTERD